MKYVKFCKQIIGLVGGKDNIQAVVHCMTRLRFTLKDRSIAKPEEIRNLDGVIDVVSNEVAFQVIIGTHVKDVHSELVGILGLESNQNVKVKKNPIKAVLDLMSESMSPILEPIMAAGMLAGILSLLVLTGILSKESQTYIIFDAIKTSVFYFLPIFLAMSCAKRLGTNPYLAVTLAVTLLSASINGAKNLSIFGIDLPTITYANSFFPIILGVWFMGIVSKYLAKILPTKSLEYFFKPVLTLIICLPVTLLVFGPIGTWIGDAINFVCTFMQNTFGNWSVVALYAAVQPFLITMGAGNFVFPVVMSFFSKFGYDPIFIVAAMISDTAVAGAMFGYFFRSRIAKQKQLFVTAGFSALMGVTEPAVFGGFVKYRRPYIAVLIGGGLGGAFAGLMQVKAYALTGLIGITAYIGNQDYKNFYFAVIAVFIGFIITMISAYLLGIPTEEAEEKKVENINNVPSKGLTKSTLSTPVKGKIIPLNEINDKAFSTGALGKGIGVLPRDNIVKSPIDGEIVTVFPTKHAIGIKAEHGIEILIHVGIDTVQLNGKHFESLVEPGEKVKKGQPIINADFKAIEQESYDTTVILVITNTADYLDVLPAPAEEVTGNENCLSVVI